MPQTMLYGEILAQAALTLLRAAASAMAAPLAGTFVPDRRYQEWPDGTLKALYCFSPSEAGQGRSQALPEFLLTHTIHIEGMLAQGREETTDLDVAVATFAQAILDLLLGDATFLGLFGWVESYSFDKEDVTTGRDATRYDEIRFRLSLELAGADAIYTPASDGPLVTNVNVEDDSP